MDRSNALIVAMLLMVVLPLLGIRGGGARRGGGGRSAHHGSMGRRGVGGYHNINHVHGHHIRPLRHVPIRVYGGVRYRWFGGRWEPYYGELTPTEVTPPIVYR